MEEKLLSRNQMHEKLLICTYQFLFYKSINEKQEISTIVNSAFGKSASKNDPFVKEYLLSLFKNIEEIIDIINPLLKENWSFDRLGFMEKSVLCLGINDIKYLNIPKPIIINVCVKLAHIYCDDNSYKFINAVLERV